MKTNDETNFEKTGKAGASAGEARGIGAELEARVVAWVTGEASAFEGAELERLSGERPEVGIFKRRIAAVSGLVGEAVRREAEPLRLGAERRAELLRKLGAADEDRGQGAEEGGQRRGDREQRTEIGSGRQAGEKGPEVAVVVMDGGKRARRDWRQRMAMIAACLVAGLIVSATLRDAHTTFYRPQQVVAESQRIERPTAVEETMQLQEFSKVEREKRLSAEARKEKTPAARHPTLEHTETADGVGMLEPFEVKGALTGSYLATNTASGTRLALPSMPTPDLSGSISVLSRQQMKDSGGTNLDSVFSVKANVEGTVHYGARGKADERAAFSFGKREDAFAAATSSGASADQRGPAAPPAAEDEAIVLSPFSVAADDKGYYAGGKSLSGTRLNSRVDDFASAIAVRPGARAMEENLAPSAQQPSAEKRLEEVSGEIRRRRSADATEAKKQIADGKNEEDKPLEKPAAIVAPLVTMPEPDAAVETKAAKEAVSTFSSHVSDVSFRLAQAALARGERPDAARIRAEEFYNAFDYGDPAPAMAEKIACKIEQSAHPVLQQRNLVRIAMKVPATGRGAGQPLRLTVLLDTSGSMEREDRAASVQSALRVLVSLLGANDRITLVGFSRQPRLLAEAVAGDRATQVLDLVTRTPSEGGTNLEAALALGAELARRHHVAGAQNRIVLLTDGAANLGDANPERLAASIEALRQQGIAFDACGVGLEGLDDGMLEALTRKGDGRYYVLDTPESADAGFARQLAGAFRPAAKNVKVQVRFNPARVGNYRLIGFEKHRLKEEDFRNDQVDAAELAAEEAAVALYQVEVLPQGEGELGEVFVRFRDAGSGEMVERAWTLGYDAQAAAFDRATSSMKLAGVAALLAEKLRGGAAGDAISGAVNLDELAPIVATLRSRYANEARVRELVVMFEQMRRLEAK